MLVYSRSNRSALFASFISLWGACSQASFLVLPPQIGHAGDGGLYAELIQDRNFDAVAHASGFSLSSAGQDTQELDLDVVRSQNHGAWDTMRQTDRWTDRGLATSKRDLISPSSK